MRTGGLAGEEPLPPVAGDLRGFFGGRAGDDKRDLSVADIAQSTTRFLFDVRYFQLDLRPIAPADGDIQPRTVVLRGRAEVKGMDPNVIVGTKVSADLVPPGRYRVRIRAFRMVGVENTGMCMDELRAEMGP